MTVHLSVRFWGLAAFAFAAVATGWLLGERGLVAVGLSAGLTLGISAMFLASGPLAGSHRVDRPVLTESDRATLGVELRNPRIGRALVEWKLDLPGLSRLDSGTNAGVLLLRSREGRRLDLGAVPLLFGLHRIGPLRARRHDPMGWAAVESSVAPSADIRVYPKREALADPVAHAKQQRTLLGAYEVSQHGYGFEFYGLRDYIIGDRPRDVNWKASGRVGRLIVNQRQKENDAEIVVLVDIRGPSGVGLLDQSPFAQGCRLALAVSEAHIRARDAVRFIAFGDDIHEDRHTGAVRHMRGIQELVIGLEPRGHMTMLQAVHKVLPSLRPRSPVIVLSPLVDDPSVSEAFALLAGHGFRVQCIVPEPSWDSLAESRAARDYAAAQRAGIAAIRRLGIPAAHLSPGQAFEAPFLEIKVRS